MFIVSFLSQEMSAINPFWTNRPKNLRNRPLCQCTAAPTIYFFPVTSQYNRKARMTRPPLCTVSFFVYHDKWQKSFTKRKKWLPLVYTSYSKIINDFDLLAYWPHADWGSVVSLVLSHAEFRARKLPTTEIFAHFQS